MAKQEARLYRGQATQDVYAADDDIKPVIAVEVTHGDGVVADPNGETGCRRESAVAPAKQDAHVSAVCIGHGAGLGRLRDTARVCQCRGCRSAPAKNRYGARCGPPAGHHAGVKEHGEQGRGFAVVADTA